MIIDAELVEQLKERLALHKKMKGVYFFHSSHNCG